MTVNTTNITSGPYSGNGVADEFAYNFRITDKSEVTVFETDDQGVQTTLTVDTDYTVAGINNDAGGQITRVAGPLPTGYSWYIRSNYTDTQLTSFPSQGGFLPAVHEAALDKLTFLVQQINDRVGRAFRLSDGDAGGASVDLPPPVPLRFLRWNAAGDAIEYALGTTSVVASDVSYTPAGDISATDVESAINELDAEKEPADPTILKDADIGVNVQAYDSDIPTEVVSQADAEAGTSDEGRVWTAKRVAQAIAALAEGGGIVLQNVAFLKEDTFSGTSTGGTWDDVTDLDAMSITLSDASNKVKIEYCIRGDANTTNAPGAVRIVRTGTPDVVVAQGDAAGSRTQALGNLVHASSGETVLSEVSGVIEDTPGAVGPHEYRVQITRASSASTVIYVNRTATDSDSSAYCRGVSTVNLLEVNV